MLPTAALPDTTPTPAKHRPTAWKTKPLFHRVSAASHQVTATPLDIPRRARIFIPIDQTPVNGATHWEAIQA
jgi:hypothetical protein